MKDSCVLNEGVPTEVPVVVDPVSACFFDIWLLYILLPEWQQSSALNEIWIYFFDSARLIDIKFCKGYEQGNSGFCVE